MAFSVVFDDVFIFQKFDANGKLLFQFGIRGRNDGEIWYPTGIAVDRNNLIYVADHGNHRMQVRLFLKKDL